MSDQQTNQTIDLQKQVKTYITILASMIVLVLVAVGASHYVAAVSARITVVVGFALVQAFLSVSYLMHLNAERKLIYWVLLLTVVLFIALLFLPVLTTADSTSHGHVS